ncbi:hypothetical protein ACVW0I_007716 [Bradyrhizobium sp. LM6.11]
MNLFRLLQARASTGKPVRVALIGAGKFGSMFLAQVPHTPGLVVPIIVDIDRDRAREACRTVGWDEARIAATVFTDDGARAIAGGAMDVVVEATGNPAVGIRHARAAIAAGKHIVMVNVEADVLAGPLLAEEARKAGVVYSLAYGDQPALTAEMVDWARATGFHVVAAGKGTKYLPAYHEVTPDSVWQHYGLTAGEAQSAGMNPQMFNSFLDGTKSAIEMAAIANACGLDVPAAGLLFPPCGVDDLPHIMRPRDRGGVLERSGVVGSGLLARARRKAGVSRSALGGLRRAGGAERLRRRLLQAVRAEDRRQRPLRCDVQALSFDRPRAEHLGAVGRAAGRANRAALRLPRRRCLGGKTQSARRRDAGRRRRLHGVGQAGAGGREPEGRRLADRPGASAEAEARRRPWPDRALERRRI